MTRLRKDGAAHKAHLVATLGGLAFAALAHTAAAQTSPVDKAPSEAARRAAMSPFRFILQNASAPRKAPAPAPAHVAAEPKKPAPPPVQEASVQPQSAAPASPA